MNIAFVTVKPSVAYQDVSALAGTIFLDGSKYVLEVVEGNGLWIQESQTQPTEGGFTIENGEKTLYVAAGDPLWVKNRSSEVDVKLNIAIFTGD